MRIPSFVFVEVLDMGRSSGYHELRVEAVVIYVCGHLHESELFYGNLKIII